MQHDAILYAFSKDTTYAKKVKKQILFKLIEFCQGAEHWLVHNARPDGSDSYGAVQGGRVLSSIASSYSLIKEARAFTNEEKDHLDRKSTRLNSSHVAISYAVFCLKKKKQTNAHA